MFGRTNISDLLVNLDFRSINMQLTKNLFNKFFEKTKVNQFQHFQPVLSNRKWNSTSHLPNVVSHILPLHEKVKTLNWQNSVSAKRPKISSIFLRTIPIGLLGDKVCKIPKYENSFADEVFIISTFWKLIFCCCFKINSILGFAQL